MRTTTPLIALLLASMKWPVMDFYVDIFLFPPVTEFAVGETLGPSAYVWGSLAARK